MTQPPPPDPQPDNVADAHGTTRASVDGEPMPRLPHERDESSDSAAAEPSEVMRQAGRDVESGKQPTDKGEATNETYNRNLRGKTPGAERD